jgi:hypothetical protein
MLKGKRNYAAPAAGGLLLAGLAAFAYYKYSRLTPEEKQDLVSNLRERGKKLIGQFAGNKASQLQGSQYMG